MGVGAGWTWMEEKKKKKQEQSAEWRNKVQRELAGMDTSKNMKQKRNKFREKRNKRYTDKVVKNETRTEQNSVGM